MFYLNTSSFNLGGKGHATGCVSMLPLTCKNYKEQAITIGMLVQIELLSVLVLRLTECTLRRVVYIVGVVLLWRWSA